MADSNGSYTFYPSFQEFVTLYQGIVRVWIGDGSSDGSPESGDAGALYAEYRNGSIQKVGMVSDYEEARAQFAELGITLTYKEWVALLVATPQNAKDSERWAVGKIAGQDVIDTDTAYHNNSKYYKEVSDENRLQSESWAVGTRNGLTDNVRPDAAIDNSKYYATQASTSASNASLSESHAATSETNAAGSESRAATSETNAAASARNALQSESNANTAKDTAISARDAAQTAKTQAEAARDDAISAKTDAQSAKTQAETAQQNAEEAVEKYPKISATTYKWQIWNASTQEYQNTDVDARGIKGDKGDPGVDAVAIDIGENQYSFYVNTNGFLVLAYGGDTAPNYYINDDGYLVRSFD